MMIRPLMIGVDFDNTIVCYDNLFFDVAMEMGLVSGEVERSKKAVRDHILAHHSNDEWTLLQSEVYGACLLEAEPHPGVMEFFRYCRRHTVPVCIVSHKSRFPAVGKAYDLHRSAWAWLEARGFFAPNGIHLSRENVYFTETRAEKLEEIARLGCTHFIDDLPEIFVEADFPAGVKKILFDPSDAYAGWRAGICSRSWHEIQAGLFQEIAV
jgi:hypothetical protein